MAEVSTTEDVALSADKVWSVIGDFSGIRKWAVLVQDESTEQTPQGPVRSLTMPDGRIVRELLVHQDAHSYSVLARSAGYAGIRIDRCRRAGRR